MEVQSQHYKIAEPEKVILDYLYLNTALINVHDFESVRLNRAECTRQIQVNKLMNYLSLYKNKTLEKRVAGFLNMAQYA